MTVVWQVAYLIAVYLVAGIPVGYLVVRKTVGFDIRAYGTGNIGTSNIYRNAGTGPAVWTGPLQFAQGFIPLFAGELTYVHPPVLFMAAVVATVANMWPVWLRFNGGRGIAVATGVVAAIAPALLPALLGVYAAGALLHGIAPGVLGGFILATAVAFAAGTVPLGLTMVALTLLVLLRRLAGLRSDPAATRFSYANVLGRLLWDRRSGETLVGRRAAQ